MDDISAHGADGWPRTGGGQACDIQRVLGPSLHARHLGVGPCNGCDREITALLNPIHDVQRLGIDVVASPRHADVLLVTGIVTRNLEKVARRTYKAMPEPRLVVAVGGCAVSGGVFAGSDAGRNGIREVLPVDVFVPGCPPRPESLIHGLLVALGRMEPHIWRGARDDIDLPGGDASRGIQGNPRLPHPIGPTVTSGRVASPARTGVAAHARARR